MSQGTRKPHPYAHAAQLPTGDAPVRFDELLPGDGPIELEIGPGRGVFIAERVQADPEVRVLAFEIRLKWAHLVDERLKKAGLGARATVLAGDVKRALPRLGPDGALRAAFMHFPDPWWKKRHEKRLVMGDELLDQLARLLRPGGELFVQTDVEERAEQYARQVGAHPAFVPAGDVDGSYVLAENPYQARSPREKRAIADGLPIHRMRWRRR